MESTLEIIFGILILIIALSWVLNGYLVYLGNINEKISDELLNNYAKIIADKIIIKKWFLNASINVKDYGINDDKLYLHIKITRYKEINGNLIKEIIYENGEIPKKFINKGEAVGIYVNNELILVHTTIYGTL